MNNYIPATHENDRCDYGDDRRPIDGMVSTLGIRTNTESQRDADQRHEAQTVKGHAQLRISG